MTLLEFQKWLDSYLNFEKTQTKNIFWLESMKFLCEKAGNPQNQIPCFHTAGSKGKGSVSAMISSIIEASGKKCGVYASPHITDFRERICTAHGFFEDKIYEKSADQLVSLVNSIPLSELPAQRPLTWFELVTVFAFICYKNAGVDFVVYETGLGGRLDSTNVVNPLASILMPIELEHTEFLGDTIEKIAAEKAGIIKQGVPCIISRQNYKAAENVFAETAKEQNSKAYFLDDCMEGISFSYNSDGTMKTAFKSKETGNEYSANMKLCGKVQALNAATAVLTVEKIIPQITIQQIEDGLENAFLPGRFEVSGNIILDGAHTVKSVANTIETMKFVFPNRKYHLLFAIAGDKDIKDIIPLFKGNFESIVFTQPETVRHCDAEKSMNIAQQNGINATVQKDLKTSFSSINCAMKQSDILLITGSFYLVAEIKNLLA